MRRRPTAVIDCRPTPSWPAAAVGTPPQHRPQSRHALLLDLPPASPSATTSSSWPEPAAKPQGPPTTELATEQRYANMLAREEEDHIAQLRIMRLRLRAARQVESDWLASEGLWPPPTDHVGRRRAEHLRLRRQREDEMAHQRVEMGLRMREQQRREQREREERAALEEERARQAAERHAALEAAAEEARRETRRGCPPARRTRAQRSGRGARAAALEAAIGGRARGQGRERGAPAARGGGRRCDGGGGRRGPPCRGGGCRSKNARAAGARRRTTRARREGSTDSQETSRAVVCVWRCTAARRCHESARPLPAVARRVGAGEGSRRAGGSRRGTRRGDLGSSRRDGDKHQKTNVFEDRGKHDRRAGVRDRMKPRRRQGGGHPSRRRRSLEGRENRDRIHTPYVCPRAARHVSRGRLFPARRRAGMPRGPWLGISSALSPVHALRAAGASHALRRTRTLRGPVFGASVWLPSSPQTRVERPRRVAQRPRGSEWIH